MQNISLHEYIKQMPKKKGQREILTQIIKIWRDSVLGSIKLFPLSYSVEVHLPTWHRTLSAGLYKNGKQQSWASCCPKTRTGRVWTNRASLYQSSSQPSKGPSGTSTPHIMDTAGLVLQLQTLVPQSGQVNKWMNEYIRPNSHTWHYLGQPLKESRTGWSINYIKNSISNIKG